jgi:glutamate--cysteine ligase
MSLCQLHAADRPGIEREHPLRFDDLLAPFAEAGKPKAGWRVGAETEKFGVDRASGAPLPYEGERSVLRVFQLLRERHGWREERESADGPVVALRRGAAGITLEPGGQLELSGSPFPNVHHVAAELDQHLAELAALSGELDLAWLGSGFHPLATQAELPWVPKARYRIMRDYFPQHGHRGIDMMRRTATVQVNLDYADEADAMRKLRVALRLSPIVSAMLANAPFLEGRVAPGYRSVRAEVWLDVDPERTGLLPALMVPGCRFEDYVRWALEVPMFLFKRDGRVVANTGQTFRSFWQHGYHGHRATLPDWEQHLTTLFPEVRLKGFLEMRCADSLPRALCASVPALWVGLLYDARALDGAEALGERFAVAELEAVREQVARLGPGARLGNRPLRELGAELLELAQGGLERRGQLDASGTDERRHLCALARLVEQGRCPADEAVDGLGDGLDPAALRMEILRRTAL